MSNSTARDWLAIGMEAWLLSAESAAVIALRGAKLAKGDSDAWQEAERMVTEKTAAGLELGLALATGRGGATPDAMARHTLRFYRSHVQANRRRLTR
jgi:hypothetical protein